MPHTVGRTPEILDIPQLGEFYSQSYCATTHQVCGRFENSSSVTQVLLVARFFDWTRTQESPAAIAQLRQMATDQDALLAWGRNLERTGDDKVDIDI